MLATAQLWAMLNGGLAPAVSIPGTSEMPAPQVGAKFQCHSSDQGVPKLRQDEEETVDIDDIPKECSHKKQKKGRPAVKALKRPHWEAFSKESEVMKMARWAYYKDHQPNSKQEGLYDLSSIFLANGHLH